MTTLTKHEQGTFCWPELATTDADAAKKFYTSLFGWTVNEIPVPDSSAYLMFQLGGRDLGAGHKMGPGEGPPHWNAYIAVDSADEAARKTKELGGNVLMEPFDVMGTIGRMAVLQDPTGGVFCVWQAGTHIGAAVLNEPGALCWTELLTTDTKKAATFYTQLIGWKTQSMPTPQGGEYIVFQSASGTNRGGLMKITPEMGPMPPSFVSYFATADIPATVRKAKELGGTVMMDVTPIPQWGQFAVLADPQGAVFAVFQPNA